MRLRLRAAGLLALAVVAITCTESTTGPHGTAPAPRIASRVTMSPQFTAAAARAYQALMSIGTDITEVHVLLTAADGSTRDTVIAFPIGQDTLHIEIPVDAAGNDQPFTALVELRTADHTVLFSGTQVVIARAANLPPLTPPIVTISYSGPGKRTKTVSIAPPDTTVIGPRSIPYVAKGIDSSGNAVSDLLVQWNTSDATVAAITPTGSATASVQTTGKRGVATLSASTPLGITGSSKLTVVPPATHLVVISGSGQTGVAGTTLALPFVIEAQAADNLPVPGTPITFSAATAGGAVVTTTATADNAGRASTTLTLGKTGGNYLYAAVSGVLPAVTVTETATPAPAAALALVSGDAQTDSTGRTLPAPLIVKVTDQFGGPTLGAVVTWTRVSGSGAFGAATSTSASDGTASNTYSLGGVAGTDVVTASLVGVPGPAGTVTFTIHTVSRGAGSITIVSGAGQSGAPNSALPIPIVARVLDSNGLPTANQLVTWSASVNGIVFSPPSSLTAANGQVSTTVTLGPTAGPATIYATAGPIAASTSVSVTTGAAATIARIAGDAQTAAAGTVLVVNPSVVVKDAGGNAVPNAPVVFAVTSGGGTATGLTTTTNAQGAATVGSWTLGAIAGPNTLTATSGSLSTTFSATGIAGGGTQLAFTVSPGAAAVNAAALTQQPVIQIKDALGNNLTTAGVAVTASITSGGGVLVNATATTTTGGTATFTGLTITGAAGSYSLAFDSPGYATLPFTPVTVSPGAPVGLAFNTSPGPTAQSGVALPTQPKIQVNDISGNSTPVAGLTVTATIASGTGALSNATAVTASNGLAIFSGLAVNGAIGAYTLQFSSGPLNAVTSGAIALAGGAASTIALSAGNGQTAAVNTAVAIAPSVFVTDANGNPVAGTVVTFDAITSGSSVANASTNGSTVTVSTNASGIAQLTAWTLSQVAQTNTMTATAAGLTGSPVSFTAQAVAGAGSSFVFTVQPSVTATSGVALVTQPSVRTRDAFGNNVAAQGVTVTASITGGSGTLTNATAVTDVTGTAVFTGLTINGTAGNFTLAFGSSGYTSLSSSNIVVSAGSASTIALRTGNNQTAAPGQPVAIPPAVLVTDANGNPVSGVSVTFTAVTSGGFVQNSTTSGSSVPVTTNATGVAALVNFFVGSVAQPYTLTATAAGLAGSPITFTETATAGAGSKLGLATAPPAAAQSGVSFAPQPVVQIQDNVGNNVSTSGVVVTATIITSQGTLANSTTVTNASGTAVFAGLTINGPAGAYTVSFDAPSLTGVTANIGVTAGPASGLIVSTTGSTSATDGLSLATQPGVRLKDSGGNFVLTAGVTINAAISSGTGSLANASATTNTNGIATFSGLAITGTVGNFTLTYTSNGLAPVTAPSPITLNVGAASTIAVSSGAGQTATVNNPVAVAPAVLITDVGGNPVSGQVVNFATIPSGSQIQNTSTSGSSLSVTSNASGIAALLSWTLSNTVQSDTVTATSTVAGVPLSGSPARIIAVGANFNGNSIAFSTQPSNPNTSGVLFATQPAIRIANGQNVGQANVPVTAFIISSTGTLNGTVTVNTNASGIATFTNLSITNTGSPGSSFTLHFTTSGTGQVTTTFTVN
ncbi:MAG: hypothetical protein ABJE47_03240 [bacterium]